MGDWENWVQCEGTGRNWAVLGKTVGKKKSVWTGAPIGYGVPGDAYRPVGSSGKEKQ